MYIHTSLGYCVVHNGNMIAFMASMMRVTGKHDKSHRKSIGPSTLNAVRMLGTSPQEMRIVTIDSELVRRGTAVICVWSLRSFRNGTLLVLQ